MNCVCAYALEWMLICIYAHKRVFVVKVYCSYLNIISVCVDGGWLLNEVLVGSLDTCCGL